MMLLVVMMVVLFPFRLIRGTPKFPWIGMTHRTCSKLCHNIAAAIHQAVKTPDRIPPASTMSLSAMSRTELVEALEKLGETPPTKWSRVELRTRLMELYEEKGIAYGRKQKTELRQGVVKLNQVSRKKYELQKWCQETLQIPVNGNETIAQLQRAAMVKIYQTTQADETDPVGFGKAASLSYGEVLIDTQYCQWVMNTAQEGQCSPQLARLASWLEQQQQAKVKTEDVPMKKGYPEPQPKIYPKAKSVRSSTSQASASSSATMDALAQIMETMKELKEEVNELKEDRPRKKEKDSEGSFVKVNP